LRIDAKFNDHGEGLGEVIDGENARFDLQRFVRPDAVAHFER